jgi:quinol monooxygenase YgiN
MNASKLARGDLFRGACEAMTTAQAGKIPGLPEWAGANPLDPPVRRESVNPSEASMKLISYSAKPEPAEENRAQVRDVFEALHAARPAGLSYMVLEADDGRFFHIVETSDAAALEALRSTPAFRTFTGTVGDRQVAPPTTTTVTIVGRYGSLEQP